MAGPLAKDQHEAAAPVADVNSAQEEKVPVADTKPVQEEIAATEEADKTGGMPATAAETENRIKSEENPESAPSEDEAATPAVENDEKPSGSVRSENKSKSDVTTLPITDDPVDIRRQVEFYFGDANLPTDKFLWETSGGPKNLPVPLKTICTFKRMHRFQPYSAIVAALKDSEYLDLAGEDGNETVKRKTAYVLDPLGAKKRVARSVYIKGFGEEEEPETQDLISGWISNYGAVDRVKLRRTSPENKFKGSIFAEFRTAELARQFVELSPPPTYKGKELKIMMKADYLDEKNRQIRDGEIEPSKGRPTFFEGREKPVRGGRGRGHHNGNGDKDGWKKRRDGDQKSGFKGGRGGRGGRGRGRGGRGRGGRDNDRDRGPKSSNNVKMPTIQATNEKGEVVSKGPETTRKRSREEGSAPAPSAKRVDTKAETVKAQ